LQGLVQAGEVRDHLVDAGEREDAPNRCADWHHQPHLAAFG
jgi:hypothetical protein